jgi:microsomal dipeptidase-like Zn-dependent dipeptidase
MRELADLNSSWMAIAYSPQQAYNIASSGRLAIILGTEIDTTGSLGFESAQAEVDWLWGLGIRQVTPIHCCDSRIGGASLFQDAYNMANDFQNRPVRDITAPRAMSDIDGQGLGIRPKAGFAGAPAVGYFFNARPGCEYPNNERGECVNWRFDTLDGSAGNPMAPLGHQEFATIDATALTDTCCHVGFTVHPAPFLRLEGHYDFYDSVDRSGGMLNTRGLTSYGAEYIRALMNHGMLIDMEHMSQATIDAIIDPGTAPGHVVGPAWTFDPNPPCSVGQAYDDRPSAAADCYRFAYPLMSSHTSYRAQSLLPGETTFKGFLSREFERSSDQVEYIRGSGGVVGPVIRQDPLHAITQHVSSSPVPTWQIVDNRDWRTTSNPPNSCASSSEGWAQAYLYSLQKMGGAGVGVGTDMVLVGGTSPRFGQSAPERPGDPYACDGSSGAITADTSAADEEHRDRSQYDRGAQTGAIQYATGTSAPSGSARYRAAFTGRAQRSPVLREEIDPAGVGVNFNDVGMLRYGQLPDLLQDVKNIGVTSHDLTPLFNSAQSYVNMWDKAYTLAGCYGENFTQCAGTTLTTLGHAVCHDTCPDDPGRGLLYAPDGSTQYVFQMPAGG